MHTEPSQASLWTGMGVVSGLFTVWKPLKRETSSAANGMEVGRKRFFSFWEGLVCFFFLRHGEGRKGIAVMFVVVVVVFDVELERSQVF